MSDDRKKPLWPWIVALLISLPVLYVASFGPACWLVERGLLPVRGTALGYKPVLAAAYRARPAAVQRALQWYGSVMTQSPLDPMMFEMWHEANAIRR